MTYFWRFSQKSRSDSDNKDRDNGLTNQGFTADPHDNTLTANDSTQNENNAEISDNFWKRVCLTICCIRSEKESVEELEKGPNTTEEGVKSATDISEEPFWRSINNGFAIILIGFASFVWGYYA